MTACTSLMLDKLEQLEKVKLYEVWIDLGCGISEPDWWWNSEPKPLEEAQAELAECLAGDWIAQILPEGVNPRADGRWDNP